MKILTQTSRIITGLVFIFSGVVKAVDPLGSAYKFHDYFLAFNMAWLDWLSLPLGILLCSTEFVAGFSLITGIRQKAGIIVIMLLMIVFTPLTFVLALTNPVSDCGCFGDAIHLTNWQTFWKNVILMILALIVFMGRKQITNIFRSSTEWIITGVAAIIIIVFSLGNLRYLPAVDFLPYKTGVRIADQMIIPEGAEPDIYTTTFIYEKNGEQEEFTLENYPADDTSWIFVDQKTILLKKGYEPPIHDFSITNMNGADLTSHILEDKGYTLLLISGKLNEADSLHLKEGFDLGRFVAEAGIGFHILTATASDDLQNYINGLNFCTVDEITLKTMVRANPGYILLKEGVIQGKWSSVTVPDREWFQALSSGNSSEKEGNSRTLFIVLSLITSLILILSIFGINIYWLFNKK
jgi:hypothetical protein